MPGSPASLLRRERGALEGIAKRFRIDKPKHFRIADHDAADCCGVTVDMAGAKALLAKGFGRQGTQGAI